MIFYDARFTREYEVAHFSIPTEGSFTKKIKRGSRFMKILRDPYPTIVLCVPHEEVGKEEMDFVLIQEGTVFAFEDAGIYLDSFTSHNGTSYHLFTTGNLPKA